MLNKKYGYLRNRNLRSNNYNGDEKFELRVIDRELWKEVLQMEKEIWQDDHDDDIQDEMNLDFFNSYAIVSENYILGYILLNKRYHRSKIAIDIEDFVVVNMRLALPFIKEIIERASIQLKNINSRKNKNKRIKYILVNPNSYSRNFVKRIKPNIPDDVVIMFRHYGGFEPYGYEELKGDY